MRTIETIIVFALALLFLAVPFTGQDAGEVRTFLSGLKHPIILDLDEQRKQAKKGTMLVDEMVVYALRDAQGQRFCVSDYSTYGERWLTEKKQGAFIILPRPVEAFGWGGLSPARRSAEETLVAELLAEATHRTISEFLNVPRESAR